MKTKILIWVLSLFIILGFHSLVLAVIDPTGDTAKNSTVGDYDILGADVTVFPNNLTDVEEYIRVDLQMKSGGKLPGMLIFEFDVDSNLDTGSPVSMVEILNSCEGGTKIKEQSGIDISVFVMLRNQSNDSSTGWCYGCTGGGGQCYFKNTPCSGCDNGGSNCYKCTTVCTPGQLNCYLAGEPCNTPRPTCDSCFNLDISCPTDVPCGTGRIRGEWYADMMSGGTGGDAPAERGRIMMPLPKETNSSGIENDYYILPWKMIVYAAYNKGGDFDLEAAKDATNLRFQISTWYDPQDPTPPANDFFDLSQSPYCAEVTDVVPNTGLASATLAPKACCFGDTESDGDVDGTDAVRFKGDFFKCTKKQCPPIP